MKAKGKRHYNIPVFIPQKACPHQCIYCNQRYISGQNNAPSLQEVKQTIELYLSTAEKGSLIQVAFFGGTFTGLDIDSQIGYLQTVKPYIEAGKIQSVRLSTRPDYINTQILDLLKQYNVTDIELGAQSLDDRVLQVSERGHTREDIIKASEMIKSYGFNLGLQMMIGLPEDTLDKSIATARTIVSLGASSTRIYPTLVIGRTPLERLYRQGIYEPLTIDDAVIWSKEIYKIFTAADITVLRVGLHPSESLISGGGYIAGPFHVSFFELVLTALWKERFEDFLRSRDLAIRDIKTITVNPKDVNYAVGYNSSNLRWLKQANPNIKIRQNSSVAPDNFII